MTQTSNENKKLFLHYEIRQEIGRGGMGVVYKVYDLKLERIVALKIIQTNGVLEQQARRFIEEIKAIAQLDHPYIVKLFEANITPFPYFTMEYIEGITLTKWIAQNKQCYNKVTNILSKTASALFHAHNNGIIHRDIKPDNILITKDDEPKVMDFGLAKNIASEHSLSVTGSIIGTPRYLSPEQIQGKKVDKRSDIYSLGVTYYECLVAQPIFKISCFVSILYEVVHHKITPPSKIQPNIPRSLETICLKCIAKKPDDRYQSMNEIVEDIDCFFQNKSIKAHIKKDSLFENILQLKKQYLNATVWGINFVLCVVVLFVFFLRSSPLGKHDLPNLFDIKKNQTPLLDNTEELFHFYTHESKSQKTVYHEAKASLYYRLRQLDIENFNFACTYWGIDLKKISYEKKKKLVDIYICENQYEKARNLCLRLFRSLKRDEDIKEMREYLDAFSYPNTTKPLNMGNPYILYLLAIKSEDLIEKESLLRKAISIQPEEAFCLQLIKLYWQTSSFDLVDLLHTTIKELNPYLVEADYYLTSALLRRGEKNVDQLLTIAQKIKANEEIEQSFSEIWSIQAFLQNDKEKIQKVKEKSLAIYTIMESIYNNTDLEEQSQVYARSCLYVGIEDIDGFHKDILWLKDKAKDKNLIFKSYLHLTQMYMRKLNKSYDNEIWNEAYITATKILETKNLWIRFIGYNYILRLLSAYKGKQKSFRELDLEAQKNFTNMQSIIENHYFTYISMGNFYYQNKEFVQALVYWNKAIEIFPLCKEWLQECQQAAVFYEKKNRHKLQSEKF